MSDHRRPSVPHPFSLDPVNSEVLPPDRVAAEQSLPELQRALFALQSPAWCWHVHDSRVEVNESFSQTFCRSVDSLADLLALFQAADSEALLSALGRALRRHKPFSMPMQCAADGSSLTLWCSPANVAEGHSILVGTFTENGHPPAEGEWPRLTEAAGNVELQQLLDAMRSMIWYLDRWGMVQHGNRKAAEWLPLERSLGCSFLELAPGWDDVAERQREIMRVIRTGEPQLDSLESCHIDGVQRWFRVDKVPTRGPRGEVDGALLVITDISPEIAREMALKESEARYRAFIANSSEAMYRFDLQPPVPVNLSASEQVRCILSQAKLAECNHVLARLFMASSPEALTGLSMQKMLPQEMAARLKDFVVFGYRVEDLEFDIRTEDEKKAFEISAIGIVEQGHLQRIWGTTRDITEKKRYLDRLEYQATHDSLTLLPNRNKLYQELEQCLRQRRPEQKMALMLLDLNRFKEINDALGHHAGDKLLRQIGPRLEMELSEIPALIARLGGDEFAILLSRIRNSQQAVVIGHRVLDALRQPFDLDGLQTEISASVGITICPDQATDVSTLMRYADVAMYHAKSERVGVSVYKTDFNPHTPKRLALMNDLGRAVRENQLELHYQPKVDLQSRQVCGFEALLRWRHPELGLIPPNEFIPLAEMTDLIHPMSLWVLENAIMQAKLWQQQGYNFPVAANLSAQNLLGDFLVGRLKHLLQKYQLPAGLLELEITESTIMVDPDRARRVLEAIDALGVTLAIDDFGTGYSSLAYLKRLPVRMLKIDGSFVMDMLEDEQDGIIVNSTINLAHNLGLRVVAEGVEHKAVLEQLQAWSCDQVQGYLVARPQPAAEIQQWLRDSGWFEGAN